MEHTQLQIFTSTFITHGNTILFRFEIVAINSDILHYSKFDYYTIEKARKMGEKWIKENHPNVQTILTAE